MARRENIFFFVSDILQLINTAYCCSIIPSIIVHLLARGHFYKKKAGKGAGAGFSASFHKERLSQLDNAVWQPWKALELRRGDCGMALDGPVSTSPMQCLPHVTLRITWALFFMTCGLPGTPHICVSPPLPLTHPTQVLTTGYQENRPLSLCLGQGDQGIHC